MTGRRFWAAAIGAMTLGGHAGAAPLQAYGQLPSIESVAISPNGQMLALAVTNGEQRLIAIEPIGQAKVADLIKVGEEKLRDVRWAGDKHLLVTASVTGYIAFVDSARLESYLASDYNLEARTVKSLLGAVKSSDEFLNTTEGLPHVRIVDGKPYAFVAGTHFVDGQGQLALFKVDLTNDTAVMDVTSTDNGDRFAIGPTHALAEQDYNGANGAWKLRARDKGDWRIIQRQTALDEPPELVGTGRAPDTVIVRFIENHVPVLKETDLRGAATGGPLPLPDADREWYGADGLKLIGQSGLYGDDERYAFFDPRDQKIWNAIVAAYPGERVSLVGYDAAGQKYVVLVDSPTNGPAYALVDMATKHANWIGDQYADLHPSDISPVSSISYKARDGLELSGYLTAPRAKPQKNLPLVVLVHGGPAARDEPGFDWWSQALASRGYAVLRVNYRGSDGLAWPLRAAGVGQWGRKMQTDLSDGVRYLASRGIVDPGRVCIVGASYGGYAALAGATLDVGVYRCAASIAGPSDLARMIDWDKAKETGGVAAFTQRYWAAYMGPRSSLSEISPAFHADRVTIPILLVHGKDDTVVDFKQSQIMADALTKAGKPCDFVTLKGEDHWLSRGATRLQMLQAVVAFLEKNNPA